MSDRNPRSLNPLHFPSTYTTFPSIPTWTSSCTPSSPFDKGVMLYMNHLSKEELQIFKKLLLDEHLLPHVDHVRWRQLKTASWAEVVHLLTEYLHGRLAWDVTFSILNKMNKKTICSLVQKELKSLLHTLEPEIINLRETSISLEKEESDKLLKYKQHVIEENLPIWNKTVWPANQADYLYRDVKKYMELLPCLFLPQSPQGRQPKTVVIHGIPGIGKTTLARKVMVTWARSEFYTHKFKYALYFHCQELNWAGKRSFSELIEHQRLESRALVSKILSKPDQLLLLFDGFEELTSSLTERPEGLSDDWSQKMPGSVLLSSLLSKRMLPEATLLIMIRPTSWPSLKPLMKHPCHVTLTGFSRTEIIKYFRAYFRHTAIANRVVDFVVENSILVALCRVPAVCWVACRCLNEQMKKMINLIKAFPNVTSVLVLYLATLFPTIFTNLSNQNHQEQLEGLCHVAAQGMWNMKWVFEKKDFQRVMVEEMSIDTFLQVNILRKIKGQEDRYVFALFIFQEFFASLFYVLYFPKRLRQYHLLGRMEIQGLVAGPSIGKTCLTQMALFLFGLLNAACAHIVEKSFSCKLSLGNKSKIVRVMTQLNKHEAPSVCCGVPQLFYCLAEIGEEAFARSALLGYRTASLNILAHEDLQASAFCLKRCRDLQKMELSLSEDFSKELWPVSAGSPSATETKEKEMHLAWWQDVCSVFRTNYGLEVLTVTDCVMENLFMKVFTDALKQPCCKLQKLYLKHVGRMLHEDFLCVLTENQHLRQLKIESTELGQEAMRSLCSALKSAQCPLKYLSLGSCTAQSRDWIDFASDLQRNTNLKTLMLRNNCLEKFGMYYLSVGHLRKLVLENCNLTEACCEGIAFSLRHSKMLTHLSLAENALKDAGAKHIWSALEYLMCPLKRLVLRHCSLTSACCQDMISALKNNKSLISLDLSLNSLRNDGIILLCESMVETDCNLLILELEQCMFTSISCQALSSMLCRYKKLRYLDLSNNDIELQGILTLSRPFLSQWAVNKVILEKKVTDEVDPYTRLMGPDVEEGFLRIVQNWNS
ncbi:NACHT, LRR and PYD domains-containing protein 8 [Nannospalax galili]|uniref:NACHT, LRR and PYD domains-containing protein 8 n=1 Tax=Nannospalax galili TaxID=1026970 RepID=UPI000819D141|nr:NACHT, LRR and PYD domains-containing protein 8 [Nannospalax galili]